MKGDKWVRDKARRVLGDVEAGQATTKQAAQAGHSQVWAMAAKTAGYPLCTQCNEPIPKNSWKVAEKDGLCPFCRDLNKTTY